MRDLKFATPEENEEDEATRYFNPRSNELEDPLAFMTGEKLNEKKRGTWNILHTVQ